MRHLLLFSSLIFSSLAYGQRTIDFKGLVEKNEIYYYKETPFTGKSVRRHENGKKAQIAEWKNGKLHGLKREWWKSGAQREQMNFVAGERHGDFVYYYNDGAKKMEGTYERNLLEGALKGFYRSGRQEYVIHYEEGVKNGLSTSYFDFGGEQTYAKMDNIEQEVLFIDGKPHGELNSYYRAGNPRKHIIYDMGVLHGPYKSWHVNGLPAEEMYYKNGVQDSVKRVWDNMLGNLIKEEYYDSGKRSGVWVNYDQFNDTVTVYHYQNDTLHGLFYSKQEGQIESIGQYVHGKKHGMWKTGLISNQRHVEGAYNMGMEIGVWWYFDHEGKKLLKRVFDNEGYITEEERY